VIDFLTSNGPAIVLVVAGLCLILMVMVQSFQVSRLSQRINQITGGVEGGDLEEILSHHLETVHQVARDLDELTARMAIVESASRHHFAKQGMVRFNPFPDTGGNQSFALALLDESDDGFIVSSLHSRTGTRIYAKAVTGGKADTSLSAEEQDAIDEARSRRAVRPATPARSAAASRPPSAPAASAAETAPALAPAAKAAPAVAKPAPAQKPAPAPQPSRAGPVVKARVAVPAPDAPVHEITQRPAVDRTKGQQKTNVRVPEADGDVEDERVDRKPGSPSVTGAGQR
jgi:hypothetical protein